MYISFWAEIEWVFRRRFQNETVLAFVSKRGAFSFEN